MIRPLRGRVLALAAWTALMIVAAAAGYSTAKRIAMASLAEATSHRIDIYSASLQAELHRYDYLPATVALSSEVRELLQHPSDPALQARANDYLQTINEKAGASAVYVMDTQGLTRAASNWNQPLSFVNINFSYRPYFRDAIAGRSGRFYGIGTVSREPGYYFADGVERDGRAIGVTAVKVDLDKLDQAWSHDGEKILVVDGSGIVFLASEKALKFHALANLSPDTRSRLASTRQYAEAGSIDRIALRPTAELSPETSVVEFGGAQPGTRSAAPPGAVEYLMQSRPVAGTDWRMLVLSDAQYVESVARTSAAVVVFAIGSAGLLVFSLRQRRHLAQQTIAARVALQKAHDELERKVAARTEALSDANGLLQSEIGERRRAEEALKATLDELVHAGKMAVLGQMSAGVTHELNQPLSALRTLSANTVEYLELGRHDQVVSNLRMIGHLSERMGDITSQLKKFARKSAVELHLVAIGPVLDDALFLLDQRIRDGRIALHRRIVPENLSALCDANRLEQVLVNLLTNAVDAVERDGRPAPGAAPALIDITAALHEGWVAIEVSDSGPGIDSSVAPHLFEPFFTTKPQGAGLGLGLAISAAIVRGFGGTLRTQPGALGGASFALRLRSSVTQLFPAEDRPINEATLHG
ncbi:MAG TPA: ATP-binding protein [Burkholderiaceae bacterium]